MLIAALPIAVRRRWPLPVFGVVLVASTASTVIGTAKDPFIALVLALYTVAAQSTHRRSTGAVAIALATTLAALAVNPDVVQQQAGLSTVLGRMTLAVVVLCGSWAIGVAVRAQHAYAEGLREQATRRAVTEERLRIARELHDVVAHGMSVIAVRAGIANYVADTQPARHSSGAGRRNDRRTHHRTPTPAAARR